MGFLVSGVSAGGNAAASMALLARDNKLEPKLTGTFLSVPATVSLGMKLPDEYAPLWLSREQNKDAPILNVPFLDFMMGKKEYLLPLLFFSYVTFIPPPDISSTTWHFMI